MRERREKKDGNTDSNKFGERIREREDELNILMMQFTCITNYYMD